MLRVYANRTDYAEEHRGALNDILKAHWTTATLEERRATYGNRVDLFGVVDSPERADLHLLAMKWPHYVDRGRVDQALHAVDLARRSHRPIVVFSESDHEANFPVGGDDIHVFQASGYRSRRRTQIHGMPAFIPDPLASFCNGEVRVREKGQRPIVGFCGQGGASLSRHAARMVRAQLRILQWRLGRARWEPPPLEHTWFRRRVLNAFQQSPVVDARFIIRAQYRAGVTQAANRNDGSERSRREFIENVLDSDYTLCVRGGGNFSVRFYEALALGRIPALIDTDCLLPYQKQVDWRRYTAMVDESQLRQAPDIVAAYHASLSPDEFRERQLECRKVWKDRLSPDGFYAHFHEHFPDLRT